jgi:predicted Na+-dependent transporter
LATYKVELTEKELKNLARDKAIRVQYWRYTFYFFVPLLVPVILSVFFRDWLKALTEPIQLVFFGAMFVPWLIVVVLLNRSISRRTQACLAELKKQGK